MLLNEILGGSEDIDLRIDSSADEFIASAKLPNGDDFSFIADAEKEEGDYDEDDEDEYYEDEPTGAWNIRFAVNNSVETTGRGGQFDVFKYAKAAVDKLIDEKEPDTLTFHAEDGTRSSLYRAFIKRYLSDAEVQEYKTRGGIDFLVHL